MLLSQDFPDIGEGGSVPEEVLNSKEILKRGKAKKVLQNRKGFVSTKVYQRTGQTSWLM
jgi:hypothetical protein